MATVRCPCCRSARPFVPGQDDALLNEEMSGYAPLQCLCEDCAQEVDLEAFVFPSPDPVPAPPVPCDPSGRPTVN